MGKNLYGKYLDTVGNIGVTPPSCFAHEVWVIMIYLFNTYYFHQLPRVVHVEVKGNISTIEKERDGFIWVKSNKKNTDRGSLWDKKNRGYFGVRRIRVNFLT